MSSSRIRLSRRQALALGAAGAAGAAGVRLGLLHFGGGSDVGSVAAGPNGAWASPLGDGRAQTAHLLRRACIGYSDADLDRAAAMSYGDLVDSLVNQKPDQLQLDARGRNSYLALGAAWYQHMATTGAPFPERVALWLHGLFTSDYRKTARFGVYLVQQNELYRRAITGDLRSFVESVTYDPAMMRYLDLDQSSGKAPNENYSRELMELFTLGVGNYSEGDVREGARALSGIRIQVVDKNGSPVQMPKRGADIQQYYQQIDDLVAQGAVFKGAMTSRLHDSGQKTYLGRSGNLGPGDVIDAILSKDACASFVATKALTSFGTPDPSQSLVSRVATAFRDSKYDFRTLFRTIFLSDEFRARGNYRSLVRSPAEYMVAAMRAAGRSGAGMDAMKAGPALGQVLYDPPTVGGWPSNAAWLSSSGWLARVNFAQTLLGARGPALPDPVKTVHNQLDNVVSRDTAVVFNGSHSDVDRWYAVLASPEFQLK